MKLIIIFFSIIILIILPTISGAHYIIGYVNNALDATDANGRTVVLWKTGNFSDNLTDIVGVTGNSMQANIYMIDCELLSDSCNIGDTLNIKVIDSGDNYLSDNASVIVTGSGFDVAPNITLNSPPSIQSVFVDDLILDPLNEIDLIAAGNRTVNCIGVVNELDNQSMQNFEARLFDDSLSNWGMGDDNNTHYTNDSCFYNSSYIGSPGDQQYICSFYLEYYSNPTSFRCIFRVEDNLSISSNGSDLTNINQLLAIGVDSPINYSLVNSGSVSDEISVNITNYGNIKMNLSLRGFYESFNDGMAMNCSTGNISVGYEKYNLTSSNDSDLDIGQFEGIYSNLTSDSVIRDFNLNYRQEDSFNDAINTTYWRIYLPVGTLGPCNGSIQFGAILGTGI
ncbi:hypothetical protein GOV12_04715 [Candidatus Pacearchaeota archaeon]|nr:hypothetical protein [Candidatus Pacearchaeota archaeon]